MTKMNDFDDVPPEDILKPIEWRHFDSEKFDDLKGVFQGYIFAISERGEERATVVIRNYICGESDGPVAGVCEHTGLDIIMLPTYERETEFIIDVGPKYYLVEKDGGDTQWQLYHGGDVRAAAAVIEKAVEFAVKSVGIELR